jgi:hypothetical protein
MLFRANTVHPHKNFLSWEIQEQRRLRSNYRQDFPAIHVTGWREDAKLAAGDGETAARRIA